MQKQDNEHLPEIYSDLLQGKVAYLYQHSAMHFWGNLILASLTVAAFLQQTYNTISLIIWFASLVLVTIARLYKNRQFNPDENYTPQELQQWLNWYTSFTLITSFIWGASAFIFFPEYSTVYQTLLIVALATVMLTSITTLTASRNAFYGQIALLIVPLIITLLFRQETEYRLLALLVTIMGITAAFTSLYVHDLLLQLHNTRQQAQTQAHTDQVTKLANRRHFDKYFKLEWRRAARDDIPLSLLMVDVDYFKNFNDTYGHQEGDFCLKQLASAMVSVARRPADLVARHGGEEFAILLPNTSIEDAALLAEVLRKKIIQLAIPHKRSLIDNVVTVSIGVSCCIPILRQNKETGEDVTYPALLLRSADAALYQAKENGRNRIEKAACGSERPNLADTEGYEEQRLMA